MWKQHAGQGQTPVWAYIFSGKRFDVGERLGFVEATIEYAPAP
jgi:UTP-glucose-1-phosphate uridylyltransferase